MNLPTQSAQPAAEESVFYIGNRKRVKNMANLAKHSPGGESTCRLKCASFGATLVGGWQCRNYVFPDGSSAHFVERVS